MHRTTAIDDDIMLLDLHGELLVRLGDRLRPKDGAPLEENLKRAKKDFRSAAAYLRPLATRTAQRPPLKPGPGLMEDEEPGPDDVISDVDSWSLPPSPHPDTPPHTPPLAPSASELQRPPLNPVPPLAEDEWPGPAGPVFPMDSWSPPPTPHPASLPPTPPLTPSAPEFVPGDQYHLTADFAQWCGPGPCVGDDELVELDIPEWYYRADTEEPGPSHTPGGRKKRGKSNKRRSHLEDCWINMVWHLVVRMKMEATENFRAIRSGPCPTEDMIFAIRDYLSVRFTFAFFWAMVK